MGMAQIENLGRARTPGAPHGSYAYATVHFSLTGLLSLLHPGLVRILGFRLSIFLNLRERFLSLLRSMLV